MGNQNRTCKPSWNGSFYQWNSNHQRGHLWWVACCWNNLHIWNEERWTSIFETTFHICRWNQFSRWGLMRSETKKTWLWHLFTSQEDLISWDDRGGVLRDVQIWPQIASGHGWSHLGQNLTNGLRRSPQVRWCGGGGISHDFGVRVVFDEQTCPRQLEFYHGIMCFPFKTLSLSQDLAPAM